MTTNIRFAKIVTMDQRHTPVQGPPPPFRVYQVDNINLNQGSDTTLANQQVSGEEILELARRQGLLREGRVSVKFERGLVGPDEIALEPGLSRADLHAEIDRRARARMAAGGGSYRDEIFNELHEDPWLRQRIATT